MPDVNWKKIKNEYINGDISYRKLADKHGVNFDTLKKRAAKEKWSKSKDRQCTEITTKLHQKTAEKIAEKESDCIVNILRLNYKMANMLESVADKKYEAEELEPKDLKALTDSLKNIRDIQDSAEKSADEQSKVVINLDFNQPE